ncbi:MAG: hypothetical protein PHR60_07035 [Eubacteriales bacterium]|nr:hypothetical protein [Eubacteriales bacterium]
MADILKIISPTTIKSSVNNPTKQLAPDAVFDLTNPNLTIKANAKTQTDTEKLSQKRLLLDLNKVIFKPLFNDIGAQAESLRQLLLLTELFEMPLSCRLINPQELLEELLTRDRAETVFKGSFFEHLLTLIKQTDSPELKEAIIRVLKCFDCYVNRENSLVVILSQSDNLKGLVLKEDVELIQQQINKLNQLTKHSENQKEVMSFLKNEYVPLLNQLIRKYLGNDKIQNTVMAAIHQIIRLDKGDPGSLEEAFLQLGELLKLRAEYTDQDIEDMKNLLFQNAKEAKDEVRKDTDLTTLLSKAIEKTSPDKINKVAQNLLFNILQSESPVIPLLHFTIPISFMGENIYGEFIIDKDCKGRKGKAKEAHNIFFTIQSDKYGTFEVDLLAKDHFIDLDIKCPPSLVDILKVTKPKLIDIIEEQNYRLTNYHVEVYEDSRKILEKFPELGRRRAGIDVKI